MKGENDQFAFGLTDDTISRCEQHSTCALCGSVRIWNVSGCIRCDRRASRRMVVLALFVLLLTAAAFGSAYYVTVRSEFSGGYADPDLPPIDVESAAEDWRSHFIRAECEECPECCEE